MNARITQASARLGGGKWPGPGADRRQLTLARRALWAGPRSSTLLAPSRKPREDMPAHRPRPFFDPAPGASPAGHWNGGHRGTDPGRPWSTPAAALNLARRDLRLAVRSACWQLSGPRRGTMRNRSALACSRLKIQNFEVPAGPCAGQDPSPRHARIFKLPGTGTLAVRWGSVPLEVLCQHYAPFRALVVGHARASAPRDHAAGRGIGSTWGCRIPVPRLDGRGLVRHATFGDFVERRHREARRCGGAVGGQRLRWKLRLILGGPCKTT